MGFATLTLRVRMPLATVILMTAGFAGAAYVYYRIEEKKRAEKNANQAETRTA